MNFQIHPASREDLEGILGIYNYYVEHTPATFETVPVRTDERVSWLEEHGRGGRHRILVAKGPNGRVVGWATTSSFRPRAAYATTVESSVYIDPGSVNLGIGARLYEDLFHSIEAEDIERIVAGITLPNPASVALHRKFGFTPVGVFSRVGRKFGKYWDVEWFERPLLGSTRR